MKTHHFSTAEIQEILKSHGLKSTPQRVAVCNYILCDGCHVTAEQVKEKMDEIFPMMSLATVYNTLKTLTEYGVLKALKLENQEKVIYDTNIEPHFHVFKQSTGEVFDLHPEEVEIRFKTSGFDLRDVMITIA